MVPQCSDLDFMLSTLDEEGENKQLHLVSGLSYALPDERIEFSSSRSGVECLFVDQGGRKIPPEKYITQEPLCQSLKVRECREQEEAERGSQSGQCLGLDCVVEERERGREK